MIILLIKPTSRTYIKTTELYKKKNHYSKAQEFSLRISASSSAVKSFLMLNALRISLGVPSFNHVRNLLARFVQQVLNIEIVCSHDEMKEKVLINIKKLSFILLEFFLLFFLVVLLVFYVQVGPAPLLSPWLGFYHPSLAKG